MPIQVFSEIGPLKRVLLHRPGAELEHLVPEALERLLFDDIPYLKGAQAEHDQFAATLRENGVEVVYLSRLTAETLAQSPELRTNFVLDFLKESGPLALRYRSELFDYLMGIRDVHEMVLKTMGGVRFDELPHSDQDALTSLLHHRSDFALEPIPNLYFTRDPFASIGRGVALNRMYSVTRRRETLYGRYILEYHRDYAGQTPLYYTPGMPFSIEGGDVLNLTEKTVAVGISQRTTPEAIECLANAVFTGESPLETILAVSIPSMRAFMHLDTVLTQVDRDKFVVHPGILPAVQVYELRRGAKGLLSARALDEPLDRILGSYLNAGRAELIPCGGQDTIASQREQWNDGSNTLCLRPGVVVAYDRNDVTNEILDRSGITVLPIPSGELSRGRGGPRCMSMPLWRE